MTTPQQGIFVEGTLAHHHLELTLRNAAYDGDVEEVGEELADAAGGES